MSHPEAPRIYPTFRYREPARMIDWLGEAFGFTTHARFGEGDAVSHAELAFRGSLIMIGAAKDDFFGAIVGQPGARNGQAVYVAVEDVDGLYARARAAGAAIEEHLTDRSYGGREFICRDPEGNVWCFGTYWPRVNGQGASS